MSRPAKSQEHSLADELERLIEHDALWDRDELGRCAARLASDPSEPAASLARCLARLQGRLEPGGGGQSPADRRLRRDLEGVLYPRLWKLVEAVRDGLPPGEQLNRVRALDSRLGDLLDPS